MGVNYSLLNSDDVHIIKCDTSHGEIRFTGNYQSYKTKCVAHKPTVKPIPLSVYGNGLDAVQREMSKYRGGKADPGNLYSRDFFNSTIRKIGILGIVLVLVSFGLKIYHFHGLGAGIVMTDEPEPEAGKIPGYLLTLNATGAFGFTCGFVYAFGLLWSDALLSNYFFSVGGAGFLVACVVVIVKQNLYNDIMFGISGENAIPNDELTRKIGLNHWLFLQNLTLFISLSSILFILVAIFFIPSKQSGYWKATAATVNILRKEWRDYKHGWQNICFNHSEMLCPGIALRVRGNQTGREWQFEVEQIEDVGEAVGITAAATTTRARNDSIRNTTPRAATSRNSQARLVESDGSSTTEQY